jgi:hypothetical protein
MRPRGQPLLLNCSHGRRDPGDGRRAGGDRRGIRPQHEVRPPPRSRDGRGEVNGGTCLQDEAGRSGTDRLLRLGARRRARRRPVLPLEVSQGRVRRRPPRRRAPGRPDALGPVRGVQQGNWRRPGPRPAAPHEPPRRFRAATVPRCSSPPAPSAAMAAMAATAARPTRVSSFTIPALPAADATIPASPLFRSASASRTYRKRRETLRATGLAIPIPDRSTLCVSL